MLYTECPSSVTVSPSSGPFKVGDVLTCTSDGYPEPSYKWTDSNEVIVSTTRTMTLPAGPFRLKCTSTGTSTSSCSASKTLSGFAADRDAIIAHTTDTSPASNTTQYTEYGMNTFSRNVLR